MSELTGTEYRNEILSIAYNLYDENYCYTDKALSIEERIEAVDEDIQDRLLHEAVDGHQWVIYNAYNLDVIKWSENKDYYTDNFGGVGLAESLECGLDSLHNTIAFWCMYGDVQDALEDARGDFFRDIMEDHANQHADAG
jgi:hypothetical protein